MLPSATLPLCLWSLNTCSIKVQQYCFAFAIIIKLQIQLRNTHTENLILDSYTNLHPFSRSFFFHGAFLYCFDHSICIIWLWRIHTLLQCVAGSEMIEPCSCYYTRHSPNGDGFSVWQVNLRRLMASGSLGKGIKFLGFPLGVTAASLPRSSAVCINELHEGHTLTHNHAYTVMQATTRQHCLLYEVGHQLPCCNLSAAGKC